MVVEQYLSHTVKYFWRHPASVEVDLSGPWSSMPSPRLFLMSSSLGTIHTTLFSSRFLLFEVLRWAESKIRKKKLCVKAYLFVVLTPKVCFLIDTLLLFLLEKLILFFHLHHKNMQSERNPRSQYSFRGQESHPCAYLWCVRWDIRL